MAFTEFCCRNNGSNLNAGTKTGNSTVPGTGSTYSSTNGNWDGTSIFTPTDGSTPASTIAAGDFASVYLDAATVAVYIGRITNVAAGVNGAITVSTTAKSGTAPGAGATGRTLTVGGAWKGPNAAENFPFGFITSALTNVAGDFPRVNIMNDAQYNITANISHTNAGHISFQGFTSAYGDFGRATIDGGTSNANLMTINAADINLLDLIVQNNATGSVDGITISNNRNNIMRCVVNNVRGTGFSIAGNQNYLEECEAYLCQTGNVANRAAFILNSASAVAVRCIAHDNAGSNAQGFRIANTGTCICCIADTNGSDGFFNNVANIGIFYQCDAYNNAGDGIDLNNGSAGMFIIENCNFIKNTGLGINGSGAGTRNGQVINCGFGSGSQANGGGTTTGLSAMQEIGSITYASGVTPYNAPATGDFTITLAAAINTGRGTFTETQASYTGTVGKPVVGAAQANAGAGGGNVIRGIIGA